jgi:transposase
MEAKKKQAEVRHVGIDLGKRAYEIAIVGRGGKTTMSNGKTTVDGRQALYKKLRPWDKVALEAGNMAFIMAKEIEQAVQGCRVYVLNPSHLALIYGSMKKTDKEDALKLAHILEDCREERLPLVPVPSDKEIQRRKLLASYRRAKQSRNRDINQLHGLFVSQGITSKARKDLAASKKREEAIQELSGTERHEAEYLLKRLALCEERIAELETQMEKESEGDEQIQRLQSIPGVGPKVAFAFAAHVAAERFKNAGQVSNYLGLVPRVYISGDTVKYGSITKRGNGYVRALLVQAAWALVWSKRSEKLKERYEYMTIEKSKSKKTAIVALARRLAEEMYALMRDETLHERRPFVPEKKRAGAKELAPLALSA